VESAALAGVLELENTGAAVPAGALVTDPAALSTTDAVRAALGPDPLGIAALLGADPATFWTLAAPTVPAAPAGGRRLEIDGAAVRYALGPPADLALSLRPHSSRIGGVLTRLIAQPTSWRLSVPLVAVGGVTTGPAPVSPKLPPPATRAAVKIRARILRRGKAGKPALVELRMSRTVKRLRVEIGVVMKGRYRPVRRLLVSGRRVVVRVRVPLKATLRARPVAAFTAVQR
jgi:hypothetical protein